MGKHDRLFREVYKIDQATNLYMIEIALNQYADIFNEWDSTPFKRRDLDPDLRLYLEESSDEIPFQYPIELYFTVPLGTRDKQIEKEAEDGIKNSFISKRYFLGKKMKQTNAQTFRFVLIGFVFLWVARAFPGWRSEANLQSILLEGLAIGGWVFLWEAVSLFFFTNRDLYNRYRTYKRLQNAPVLFREVEKP